MSQNLQNTIILRDVVKRYRDDNELSGYADDQIFEIFAIQQIAKDSNLSFEDIEDSVVDDSSDGGIDSFIILVDDAPISTLEEFNDLHLNRDTRVEVYITQAKMAQSFSEKVLDRLYITVPVIFDLDIDEKQLWTRFNAKLVEKIVLLRNIWPAAVQKHITLEIQISYACMADQVQINQAVKSKTTQIKQIIEDKTVRATKVRFTFFSAKELIELYQKPQSTSLQLRFKENPTPIEYKDGEYGYIGVVNLGDYYDFIVDEKGSIREFILEENVRHYQGEVDVNRGIRQTLESDFSVDFWWLNNGITIIASRCMPYPRVLHLDDVQVVNGLQTSYTIGRFYDKNREPDQRSILVKVLIVRDDDKQTIDKIISSSNRQNPVTSTVLRATDDIQRKLELFFFNRGYYYDRRKNYYKNQSKPAKRIFSIQYTAQAIEAILNFNPSAARSHPTTLIKSDSTYKKIFDESRSFEAYLKCCLLFQQTSDFIKMDIEREARSEFRNYSYHLARIFASILTAKAYYHADDIRNLDLTISHIDDFKRGYRILVDILAQYQSVNTDAKFANYISKTSKFTTAVNTHLKEYLS